MDGLHRRTAGLPLLPAGQARLQAPQLLLQTPDQRRQALLLTSSTAGKDDRQHRQGEAP